MHFDPLLRVQQASRSIFIIVWQQVGLQDVVVVVEAEQRGAWLLL